MARSAEALVRSELLVWARESSHIPIEIVAKRLGIPLDKLEAWEEGSDRPTTRQAKELAHIYKQPFAAFYLPKPPSLAKSPVNDFRRLPSENLNVLSPELAFEIRRAVDRREIALEILAENNEIPSEFKGTVNRTSNAEAVGKSIRELLDINYADQRRWRQPNEAFNKWKAAIESVGVLVFQAKDVNVKEMRGFSIFFRPLPIIVVNRKDAYVGRIFSMLHEITHLLLRTSGLCDMQPDTSLPTEVQEVEIFCNQVAAASLIPQEEFLTNEIVRRIGNSIRWTDNDIANLAANFGASREAIVRRLLTFQLITNEYYKIKREQYSEEREHRPPKKGFVTPDVDAVSLGGKPFNKIVLGAYYADRITAGDVSDYLGVKSKHFKNIWDSVGG